MAILRAGAFFEDDTSYIFGFSDSGVRLEVTDGHVLSLTLVTSGPFLSAARPGSGMPNPDALGEIIIRDLGSRIELISAGSSAAGASLSVAYGEDTRGVMQVLDGAEFLMTDLTCADNSDLTGGGEAGWIGRGDRAEGTVAIRAAEFLLTGTGSNLSVGRDGGTGAVHVTQGAVFRMETTSADAADFTHLRVGIDDGTGLMEIGQSFALVQAGLNANGAVDIGRNGGTGTLNISGSDEEPYREGLFLVGNAFSPSVEMRVGYQGGFGNLSMDGGTLAIANSGVEVLREGGSQRWPGEGEMGGSAGLFVGREGGTGEFAAVNIAQIFVGARTDAAAHIGVGDGADGTGWQFHARG